MIVDLSHQQLAQLLYTLNSGSPLHAEASEGIVRTLRSAIESAATCQDLARSALGAYMEDPAGFSDMSDGPGRSGRVAATRAIERRVRGER